MRKQIEDTITILKFLAVDIHNGKLGAADAEARIVKLALDLQRWIDTVERTTEEKLDFLIFMQSKRSKAGGKDVIFSGEVLFSEWRDAMTELKRAQPKPMERPTPKPIPNENEDFKS